MRLATCMLFIFVVMGCVPVQSGAPAGPMGPPPAPGSPYQGGAAEPAPPSRPITINGSAPTPAQLASLEQMEASYGTTLPPGNYWYDSMSGLFGRWGGPTEVQIRAGLDLGPQVPANASGGGTDIMINGRIINPQEKAFLESLVGSAIAPGRYNLDAQGNAGLEGQPPTVNLLSLAARQRTAHHGNTNTNANGGGNGGRSISGPIDANGNRSSFDSDGKCKVFSSSAGTIWSGCN